MSDTTAATRTRTFTGTMPETGQPVLVHLFEEATASTEWEIKGMEVALKEGWEGRFARWGLPATMTEET